MRVPYEWLKEYVGIEADVKDIATRLTMGGLEVEGIEDSDLGPVIDVYVTPNRGDCLSIVGVAREVAALYGLPLKPPVPSPSADGGAMATQTSITIQNPDLCPRYAARIVRNINIGPSPDWMQKRLAAAGQRPINNVVDVTNYVMLELGQPLHAFDLDHLSGGRIVVRRANEGERMTTLDQVERELTTDMLVIADADRAVAVAGVMGGATSEVSDATTNVLFESAHFNSLSVRRTSRALGLRTEASYRFERVVDPDGVRRAVDRACQLLDEIGQPAAEQGVIDVYPSVIGPKHVALRVKRASELLGMDVPQQTAADALRSLGFDVQAESSGAVDTLRVVVPTFRPDVTIEEDLIEEVGRIHGYENIPETLPLGVTTRGGDSEEGAFISEVRRILAGCGMQEVVTHSLTAPSFFDTEEDASARVAVRNALSADVGGLRRSLIPAMLDVAESNFGRGQQALALFEVGRVWHLRGEEPVEAISVGGLLVGPTTAAGWQPDSRRDAADIWQAKGVVKRLLNDLRITGGRFLPPDDFAIAARSDPAHDNAVRGDEKPLPPPDPTYHPGRVAAVTEGFQRALGVVGELHPVIACRLSFRDRITLFELSLDGLMETSNAAKRIYKPLSKFPAVTRDLAPRVPIDVPFVQVETAVRETDAPYLEELRLTDVYTGAPLPDDVKSLTLSLTFRSNEGTLTDRDVNGYLTRIRESLESVCGATFAA